MHGEKEKIVGCVTQPDIFFQGVNLCLCDFSQSLSDSGLS